MDCNTQNEGMELHSSVGHSVSVHVEVVSHLPFI